MGRRRGFTLIELLVVAGMIVALATILLPALHRAYQAAERSRMAADLHVIDQALEAYRNDFGDYPRPGLMPDRATYVNGAQILAWALIAAGPATDDGADGPGFRIRGRTGTIYGPYLPPDQFELGVIGGGAIGADIAIVSAFPRSGGKPFGGYLDRAFVVADRQHHVILYYTRHAVRPTGTANSYVACFWNEQLDGPVPLPGPGSLNQSALWAHNVEFSTEPKWNAFEGPYPVLTPGRMKQLLGAGPNGGVGTSPPIDTPYLLISAGTASPYSIGPGIPSPFGTDENVSNVQLLVNGAATQ